MGGGDAWISLGRGNARDFVDGLVMDGDGQQRDQVVASGMEGKNTDWNYEYLRGAIWTQCSGNVMDSTRLTLVTAPSNVGTRSLNWSFSVTKHGSQTWVGDIRPVINPALFTTCTGAMVAQKLYEWPTNDWFSFKYHTTRENPFMSVSEWPGIRSWMAQRPKVEPNMIGQNTNKKTMKGFLVIVCCMHRSLPWTTNRSRCRDHNKIRQNSGNPTEDGEEGLQGPEGSRTPGQQSPQHQLSRALYGFTDTKATAIMDPARACYRPFASIFWLFMQWFCETFNSGRGVICDSCTHFLNHFIPS